MQNNNLGTLIDNLSKIKEGGETSLKDRIATVRQMQAMFEFGSKIYNNYTQTNETRVGNLLTTLGIPVINPDGSYRLFYDVLKDIHKVCNLLDKEDSDFVCKFIMEFKEINS